MKKTYFTPYRITNKNKNRIAKTMLYNIITSTGITFPDFKLHYKDIVVKPHGIVIKRNKLVDGIESKDLDVWL